MAATLGLFKHLILKAVLVRQVSAVLLRIRARASPSQEVLIPCTFLPLCHLSTPMDIFCGLSLTAEDIFLAGSPQPFWNILVQGGKASTTYGDVSPFCPDHIPASK